MSNTPNQPPKLGRPHGSESTKRVTIERLLNHLSQGAEVPVSQKFLTTVGIPYDETE